MPVLASHHTRCLSVYRHRQYMRGLCLSTTAYVAFAAECIYLNYACTSALQHGAHHHLEEFAERGKEPKEEVQVYTWMDATLRELTELIQEVQPAARRQQARLEFALIYPDRRGRNVLREVCLWALTHDFGHSILCFACFGKSFESSASFLPHMTLWCLSQVTLWCRQPAAMFLQVSKGPGGMHRWGRRARRGEDRTMKRR